MTVAPDDIERRHQTTSRNRFMLRCRMSPSLRDRIDRIVEHDEANGEINWCRSDAVREALLQYVERREAEIAFSLARDTRESGIFLGQPPLRDS